MHEDDVSIFDASLDGIDRGLCVFRLPVERVDRPEDHRHRKGALHILGCDAARKTGQCRRDAGQLLHLLIRFIKFTADIVDALLRQLLIMIPAVVSDLVAVCHHALHFIRILIDAFTDDEEGTAAVIGFEDIHQMVSDGRLRTVIPGERHHRLRDVEIAAVREDMGRVGDVGTGRGCTSCFAIRQIRTDAIPECTRITGSITRCVRRDGVAHRGTGAFRYIDAAVIPLDVDILHGVDSILTTGLDVVRDVGKSLKAQEADENQCDQHEGSRLICPLPCRLPATRQRPLPAVVLLLSFRQHTATATRSAH